MELLLGLAFMGFAMLMKTTATAIIASLISSFFIGIGLYNWFYGDKK